MLSRRGARPEARLSGRRSGIRRVGYQRLQSSPNAATPRAVREADAPSGPPLQGVYGSPGDPRLELVRKRRFPIVAGGRGIWSSSTWTTRPPRPGSPRSEARRGYTTSSTTSPRPCASGCRRSRRRSAAGKSHDVTATAARSPGDLNGSLSAPTSCAARLGQWQRLRPGARRERTKDSPTRWRFRPPSPGTFRLQPCGGPRTASGLGFNLNALRGRRSDDSRPSVPLGARSRCTRLPLFAEKSKRRLRVSAAVTEAAPRRRLRPDPP
jgi:hypothetical protein